MQAAAGRDSAVDRRSGSAATNATWSSPTPQPNTVITCWLTEATHKCLMGTACRLTPTSPPLHERPKLMANRQPPPSRGRTSNGPQQHAGRDATNISIDGKNNRVTLPSPGRSTDPGNRWARAGVIIGAISALLATLTYLGIKVSDDRALSSLPPTNTSQPPPAPSADAPSTGQSPSSAPSPRSAVPDILVGSWGGGSTGATADRSYTFGRTGDVLYRRGSTDLEGTVVVNGKVLTLYLVGMAPQEYRWSVDSYKVEGYSFSNLYLNGFTYVRQDSP
jgi:hypothetical protein